jgi:hypothetical protein
VCDVLFSRSSLCFSVSVCPHFSPLTPFLFRFPKETLCPITLYELGVWSSLTKHEPGRSSVKDGQFTPVMIGVDPDYARKDDVRIQTGLCRPEVPVVEALDDLVAAVGVWYDAEMQRRSRTSRVAQAHLVLPIAIGLLGLAIKRLASH